MTNKPTGGQAYPSFPTSINSQFQYQGMTMRDAFAIAALQGAMAYPGNSLRTSNTDEYATYAYAMADAMLLEREK